MMVFKKMTGAAAAIAAALLFFSCSGKEDVYKPGSAKPGEGGEKPQTEEPKEADWSKLTTSNHPRLMLTDDECQSLKSRIAAGSDELLVKLHNSAISTANSNAVLNGSEIVYQLDVSGKRILNQSNDATNRLLHLAYAWRMTGDDKYLDAADQILNWVCKFPDWNARKHFLDPSQMTIGVALAYDWLYKGLSDATKALVEKAIQDFLFYPAQHKQWNLNFYEAENNWNSWCNCGLVLGAMAIYEKAPKVSREIIDASIASCPIAIKAMFSPSGAYHEGYSYWSSSAGKQAIINTVLKECLGTDFGLSAIDGWDKASICRIFLTGIDGIFNYADCGTAAATAPGQWYFAWDFDNPSALYQEIPLAKSGAYTGQELPLVLCWAGKMSSLNLGEVQAPSQRIFSGSGQTDLCIIRTLWDKSAQDKYLGIKGGMASSAHGHMDAGSFVYDAQGVRWSYDLGLQSYTTLENAIKQKGGALFDMNQSSLRWKVLRLNNRFHSTLTINDEDHLVNGYASISGVVDSKNELGCTVDLTPVFGEATRSAKRYFSLKGDVLTVTDEIQAPKTSQAKVSWRMVTKADVTVEKDHIKLQMNGKTMYLKAMSTGPSVEYATWAASWPTSPLAEYDAANPGITIVGFNGTVTTGKTITFTTTLSPTL